MSNGARSLTVREFLHCYRPDEIDKSKEIYSFVPRKSVLKVIYETPDSNRDQKSRYFFLKGDGWMYYPGETDHMPVDKTWGILDPSGIHIRHVVYVEFFNSFDSLSLFCLPPSSSYFLQSDGAPRLTLRSIIFSRKFSQSPSQRNKLGLSSSTSIPSTGIAMDLNLLQQPLSTRNVPVNVSPSTISV